MRQRGPATPARDLPLVWPEDAAESPADRLAALRLRAGYPSAKDAAQRIGISAVTYQHHENGARGINRKAAAVYERHFSVPPGTILYGIVPGAVRDEGRVQQVPVFGAIVQAGRIAPRMNHPTPLPGFVSGPPLRDDELQALVVDTDDLYPAYRPGDVVYYAAPASDGWIDSSGVEGQECVIETAEGDMLLRVVHAAPDGSYTLTTYAQPPRHGVRLRSASPVLWVARGMLAAGRQAA